MYSLIQNFACDLAPGNYRRSSTSARVGLAAAACVAAGGLFSSMADAAAIIVQDSRQVSSSGSVSSSTTDSNWTVRSRPASGDTAFNASKDQTQVAGQNSARALGQQTSQVSGTSFSGTGEALATVSIGESGYNYNNGASASAMSTFQVTFQVKEATHFDLTGLLSFIQTGSGCCSNGGGASLTLSNGGYYNQTYNPQTLNLSFGSNSSSSNFIRNIDLSGLLDPDTYTLVVNAQSSANPYSVGSKQSFDATFSFQLDMSPVAVPVPAAGAAWFFSSALGLLGFARPRKRSIA